MGLRNCRSGGRRQDLEASCLTLASRVADTKTVCARVGQSSGVRKRPRPHATPQEIRTRDERVGDLEAGAQEIVAFSLDKLAYFGNVLFEAEVHEAVGLVEDEKLDGVHIEAGRR